MSHHPDQRNDAESWERFWQRVMSDPTVPVVWSRSNFDSFESMAPYLEKIIDSFDRDLPLVDFGCGDGELTEHFTDYFDVVVGADISEAAIAKALRDNQGSKVGYERLDGTDTVGAERLHARLGDVNVHVRGVLQAMMPTDWPQALRSLEILTGRAGSVFDIEFITKYSQRVQDVERLDEEQGKMLRGPGEGLVPNEFSATGLVDLYRSGGWRIRSTDELDLHLQVPLPDGGLLSFPTVYVIATKGFSRPC